MTDSTESLARVGCNGTQLAGAEVSFGGTEFSGGMVNLSRAAD
jgi:hypothetical protein